MAHTRVLLQGLGPFLKYWREKNMGEDVGWDRIDCGRELFDLIIYKLCPGVARLHLLGGVYTHTSLEDVLRMRPSMAIECSNATVLPS